MTALFGFLVDKTGRKFSGGDYGFDSPNRKSLLLIGGVFDLNGDFAMARLVDVEEDPKRPPERARFPGSHWASTGIAANLTASAGGPANPAEGFAFHQTCQWTLYCR